MRKKRLNSVKVLTIAACVCLCMSSGCSMADRKKALPDMKEYRAEEGNIEEGNTEERSTEEGRTEEETAEVLLAAAASLKNAFEEELFPMFREKYPQISIRGTFDSSGKLQAQIEEGMEADVFIPAAKKQMEDLEKEGWIASETVVDLLENKIVLIVPAGDEDKFSSFADIERAGQVAIGDPDSVPAGQYAREALLHLGIWETVLEKASLGTNVTEVLSQVAAASAEAGIVYATDAASIPDKVSVVAQAPEGSLSQKVIYPAAVLKNTKHREAAETFVKFLSTPEAMEVFISYGFTAGNGKEK